MSDVIVAPLMPTRGHPHFQAEHSLRVASVLASRQGIQVFHPRHRTSSAVHENRNCMIADLVVNCTLIKQPFTHILFQDDDIRIPEDAIIKLVEANKPIVGALCTTRSDPPIPNAKIFHQDSGMWENILEYNYGLGDRPLPHAQPYGAIGTGLVLLDYEKAIKPMAMIYLDCLYEQDVLGMPASQAEVWSKARKEAFNQYPNAWWYRWMAPVNGVDENSEDVFFCWTAKRYCDLQTWVDTSIQPGHIGEVAFTVADFEARRSEVLDKAKAEGRYHPENGAGALSVTPKIFVAMKKAAMGEDIEVQPIKQPFVETSRISVILPTRGRWEMMDESIGALLFKANDPDSIDILVRHDDDDPPSIPFTPKVRLFSGARHGYRHLHLYYNELAEKATGDWILSWSDDAVMETEGWDDVIRAQGGGLKILNATGGLNLFPIVTRELYEVLGHWSLQAHCDSWLQVIGRMNGIEYPVDLKIRHLRDEGLEDKTKKESLATYATTSPEFFSRIFQEKLRTDVKKVHKAVERLQKQALKEEFSVSK